jgi:hypothetical protein
MTDIYLGCDPDLRHTAIALLFSDPNETPILYQCDVPKKLRGADACRASMVAVRDFFLSLRPPAWAGVKAAAVESQELYSTGPKAAHRIAPQPMIWLAQICGNVLGHCQQLHRNVKLYCPAPKEWKGQVPKGVFHERIRSRLHKVERDAVAKFSKSRRSHVLDACGLALWARKMHEDEMRRGG